jgi:hypothetical protein
MSKIMNLSILENIRNHLLKSPGTFKWNDRAVLWDVEIIDLYECLKFLRLNGFTRNDRGKVYWEYGDISDVQRVLEQQNMPSIEPEKNSLKLIKSPDIPVKKKQYFCLVLAEVEKISFAGVDICQLQSKLSRQFDPKIVHAAAIKSGATVYFDRRAKKIIYFKLVSEVIAS